MTKLSQPPARMTVRELHGEIRSHMKIIRVNPKVLDEALMTRLEALVDEIGYRNNKLTTLDQDQQRKLNWWRTLAVAVVAFGFCVISILIAIMLTKGA